MVKLSDEFVKLIQSNLVLRNHFSWPIVNLLRKDKEHWCSGTILGWPKSSLSPSSTVLAFKLAHWIQQTIMSLHKFYNNGIWFQKLFRLGETFEIPIDKDIVPKINRKSLLQCLKRGRCKFIRVIWDFLFFNVIVLFCYSYDEGRNFPFVLKNWRRQNFLSKLNLF